MDISVIIPSYNSEDTICLLVESLFFQKTQFSYEIIVVDNESSDRTLEKISNSCKNYPVSLKIVNQPRGVTISVVRNYGASIADGMVLAFIDSDCVPPNDWIQKGMLLLKASDEPALLAGGCAPPPNGTWVERSWHSTRAGHNEGSIFVHGANLFITKSLFMKARGFNEALSTCEDYDLGQRVSISNKILQASDFTVTHYGEANTIIKKIKKERWYGQNMTKILSNNFLYKPFWLSLIFLLTLTTFMVSLILYRIDYAIISLLIILLISSSLALFFCIRSNCYKFFIYLIPICFAYLTGRSLGILDHIGHSFLMFAKNNHFISNNH